MTHNMEELHEQIYLLFQENVMRLLRNTDLTAGEMHQAIDEAVENYVS